MTSSRILVKSDPKNRRTLDPAPETGWYLLGGLGLVFAVVALADLTLAFYPMQFGNKEWEFGTITTVLGSLPLLTMGLGLAFGAAVARGNRLSLRLFSVLFALVAVLILALALTYAATVPVAMASETDPTIRFGLRKAIVRTLTQGVLYPAAFLWIARLGWKHAKTGVTP